MNEQHRCFCSERHLKDQNLEKGAEKYESGFIRLESNYLVGPFYAGPNLTPALFTPALIPPPQESALTPFRAAFYAGQRPRKEKI